MPKQYKSLGTITVRLFDLKLHEDFKVLCIRKQLRMKDVVAQLIKEFMEKEGENG